MRTARPGIRGSAAVAAVWLHAPKTGRAAGSRKSLPGESPVASMRGLARHTTGGATSSSDAIRELYGYLRPRAMEMARLLGRFVRAESPSYENTAVDRFGRLVAAEWRKRRARVEFLRQRKRGDHLRIALWRGRPLGQILVLGHLDTVYDLGTLA